MVDIVIPSGDAVLKVLDKVLHLDLSIVDGHLVLVTHLIHHLLGLLLVLGDVHRLLHGHLVVGVH